MYRSLRVLSLLLFILHGQLVAAPRWSDMYYYPTPATVSDSSLTIDVGGPAGTTFRCEARVSLDKVSQTAGDNRSWWGLTIVPDSSDTLTVAVRFVEAPTGETFGKKWGRVTVTRGGSLIFAKDFNCFATVRDRYNSLGLRLDHDGRLIVSGGGKRSIKLFDLDLGTAFAIRSVDLWSVGDAKVSLFVAGCDPVQADPATTEYTLEGLRERFAAGGDPVEGFWKYFDRQNDPRYARPGGRYTLAVVKSAEHDGYDILLVDGAEVYCDRWKPMMYKGSLHPTVFAGHYDLKWIDSTFRPMDRDIHATIEDDALLTLSFPLYKTTMRFAKIDKF